MKTCLFVLLVLFSSNLWAFDYNPVEKKWGAPLNGPVGLKGLVVAVVAAKNQPNFSEQKFNVSKPTTELLDMIDVMPILYTYDSLASKRDIKDLAELTPYYLGEAAGSLYECLIYRKGTKVLPFLKALEKEKTNECLGIFGEGSRNCFDDNEYQERLHRFIKEISDLTRRGSTTAGCTTEGWSSM